MNIEELPRVTRQKLMMGVQKYNGSPKVLTPGLSFSLRSLVFVLSPWENALQQYYILRSIGKYSTGVTDWPEFQATFVRLTVCIIYAGQRSYEMVINSKYINLRQAVAHRTLETRRESILLLSSALLLYTR